MSGTGDSEEAPGQIPPVTGPWDPAPPSRRAVEGLGQQSPSDDHRHPADGHSQALSPVFNMPAARALLISEFAAWAIWTVFSFIIVYWACQTANLESTTWLIISLWILSGLVVLWPGVDGLLVRLLLSARQPTMVEQQRMTPSWMAAAHRLGVFGPNYSLWIEDSKDATASMTLGHTIAVTHWSLYTLPPSHLEAVLARELMTHMVGRSWVSRLGSWYSIPARLIALAIRGLMKLSRTIPAVGWTIVCFLLVSYLGLILVAVIFYDNPLGPLLYLTPFTAPLILLGLKRWNERMADRAAADLGYGPRLIEVLYGWQSQHQSANRRGSLVQPVVGASSVAERIRALEIYQQRL